MKTNLEEERVLVKYSAPSKFTNEPYGQIWQAMHDDNLSTLYIQTSKNEAEPHWMKMGDFLEKAFAPQLNDEKFIKGCLGLIEQYQ